MDSNIVKLTHVSYFILMTIYGTREVKISYTFSPLFLHIVFFQLPQNWCSYLYLSFKISTVQIVQQFKKKKKVTCMMVYNI